MRQAFAILLLALLAFWPSMHREEWRHTEGRRVQIATEMVESGDWMVPTIGYEATLTKPPLHYWLLAGLIQTTWPRSESLLETINQSKALLRMSSVIAFWLLALLVFRIIDTARGRTAAWLGVCGILFSPVLLHQVPSAEIDPLFTALTAASLIALSYGIAYDRCRSVCLGGVLGGCALLAKGPPYFLFIVGAMIVWARRAKLQHWSWFFLPLFGVPLLYFVPLLAFHVDLAEFLQTVERESVSRFVSEWSQVLSIPSYLLQAAAAFLPFAIWTFYEYRGDRARSVRLERYELLFRMTAAAAIVGVLLLVLFRSRPTRYFLPAIPLFIFSIAPAVAVYIARGQRPGSLAAKVVRRLAILGSGLLVLVPFTPFPVLGGVPWFFLALAVGSHVVVTRAELVGYALAIPLVAAWTVMPLADDLREGVEWDRLRAGRVMERELDQFDVHDHERRDLSQTFLKWRYGEFPAGSEVVSPDGRWSIVEEPDRKPATMMPGWADRLRVWIGKRSLVLRERTPR